MNKKPLLVHFGAGNIGRSLVGTLFSPAGYDIIFVDAAQDVVAALQERNSYRVFIKDNLPAGTPDTVDVTGVDGLDARDTEKVAAAVARADVIGTSVGAGVLPIVLKTIAAGLVRRQEPVSLIFCENLHDVVELARSNLKKYLPEDFDLAGRVGLVATSIGKMVPIMPSEVRKRDPLEVWGEAYNQIIADGQAFVGAVPRVKGLLLKDNFQAWVDRKLFVHNQGHAICGCFGYLYNCELLPEAMAVKEVAEATAAAMRASAAALMVAYPGEFTEEEQEEHVLDLLRRFQNVALGDSCFRVGRDLPRKLASDDRFVGALRLVKATTGDTKPICRGIASALHFAAGDEHGERFPGDDEVRARVALVGVSAFLQEHAKLDAVEFARELEWIEEIYRELQPLADAAAVK